MSISMVKSSSHCKINGKIFKAFHSIARHRIVATNSDLTIQNIIFSYIFLMLPGNTTIRLGLTSNNLNLPITDYCNLAY